MKEKSVIMLSGGLDSSVALYLLREEYDIQAILFDFGQRSIDPQIACARRLCAKLGVPLEIIDISGLKQSLLGLAEDTIIGIGFSRRCENCPHALFGLAASYTLLVGATTLINAVHQDDFIGLGLNNPEDYLRNYGKDLAKLQGTNFILKCPFLDMKKTDVIRLAHDRGFPMDTTRSCTEGTDLHCGECAECLNRKKAFRESGIADPTLYLK